MKAWKRRQALVNDVIDRYLEENEPVGTIDRTKMPEEDREVWEAHLDRWGREWERFRKLFPRETEIGVSPHLMERMLKYMDSAMRREEEYLHDVRERRGEDDVFAEHAEERLEQMRQDKRDFQAFIMRLRRKQLSEED